MRTENKFVMLERSASLSQIDAAFDCISCRREATSVIRQVSTIINPSAIAVP